MFTLFTLCGCTKTMSSFISPNIRLHPLQDSAASGLVGHQSLKKPIFRERNLSRPDLKLLTDTDRLKKYNCVHYITVGSEEI